MLSLSCSLVPFTRMPPHIPPGSNGVGVHCSPSLNAADVEPPHRFSLLEFSQRHHLSMLKNTGSPPDTASFLSWSPQIRTATSVVISSSWGCHLQFVSHCSSQGALPFHGSHCILPDFLLQVHLVFLYAEKWRRPGSSHPCTRWHFSIKRLLLLVSLTKPFLNQNFSCFLCMLTRSLLFKMTRSWYLLINEIRESHFIKLAHASKCALHTPA
ncbi:uncharacterized protein LOC120524071 isoform X1 [Polypterus senegalus]|uniref:uncharacterized protein LOC120524071 isoform X1 n=1 Tax=Polypterus senegalus TaxID=55291 RepID=UPI0019664ECB|nr:uncharacterized protein LOC120524071 isoform X1 [Polypterus senegalus]